MAKNPHLRLDTPPQYSSKRHRETWKIIKELFPHNKVYQEYPVHRLNPDYYSRREHYDIVILDLNIVIEVHGEQHFRPVRFGGCSQEEAILKFNNQKLTDQKKKDAALEAGYTFIEIRYDEEISHELILRKIQENFIWEKPIRSHNKKNVSEYERRQRARIKELRRENYRRRKKELKKQKTRRKDELDGSGNVE